MKLSELKKIRVWVSLLFLVPVVLLFTDPRNSIPDKAIELLTSLQLVPALIKAFSLIGWSVIGLVLIVLITLLFGRVYCSTICPLGTIQDIVIFLKRKIAKRKRYRYEKPQYLLHYLILALTAASFLLGNSTLLNLTEPFSNTGRIFTNLVEPATTWLNNLMAGTLAGYQLYFLYDVPLRSPDLAIIIGSVSFLAVIGYLAYSEGRFFCNSLCPAGAILSLISRMTLYKIKIDESSCSGCGACEKVCKANCIESETKKIDFSACVGCFNCIRSCPTEGIAFSLPRAEEELSANRSRRSFFKAAALPVIGTLFQTVPQSDSTRSGYWTSKRYPVSPPGSRSIDHFTTYCTACHLCVTVCPTQVLYPSFTEYGPAGIFQPRMNFDESFCNYECTKCGTVCPTGAILPLSVEDKKLVQIGKALFIKEDCVVVSKKKDCSACSEHCPTKAVRSVPYEGTLKIPELDVETCTGCGACEHACPTTPRKAIYVSSHRVHQLARKPVVEKQKDGFDSSKEFPF